MTVSIVISRIQYDGDNVELVFIYPFKIYEDDDLSAIVADSDGVEGPLILNTDYTVSGAGNDAGGSITLVAGSLVPVGSTLTLIREIDLTQDTDHVDGQKTSADSLEAPPDKSRLIDQQIIEKLDRSLHLRVSETGSEEATRLPSLSDRIASELLGFDAEGNFIAVVGVVPGSVIVSAFMETVLDDADAPTALATLTALAKDGSVPMTGTFKQAKGADIASATVLPTPSDGNYNDVTGTTTITSIATSGNIGTVIKRHFDGTLILIHDAVDLILPGGVNIPTEAGGEAEFIEYASGKWICTNYQHADGTPLLGFASEVDVLAGTSTSKGPSVFSMAAHSGVAKAWVNFNGTGTIAIRDSFNVSSLTDKGVGDYTVTYASSIAADGSSSGGCTEGGATGTFVETRAQTTTYVDVRCVNHSGVFIDCPLVMVQSFAN